MTTKCILEVSMHSMHSYKILFYSEVPTAHLDELTPLLDGSFVIATECLKDSAYFDWYCNRPRNCRIMLDNGAFEEGHPLSPRELLEIADALKPEIVFAPDVLHDRLLTMQLTAEFLALSADRPWKVGVIPQGDTPFDVYRCYKSMLDRLDFRGPVGLSFLNDRRAVCDIITSQRAWRPLRNYHFLGMYNLLEALSWPSYVTSCDTIKPLKAAFFDYDLEDCPRGLGQWSTTMIGSNNQITHTYRNYARMHQALTKP